MKFIVTIEWKAPGDIATAEQAIRTQLEALRVDAYEDYRILKITRVSPSPKKWWKW